MCDGPRLVFRVIRLDVDNDVELRELLGDDFDDQRLQSLLELALAEHDPIVIAGLTLAGGQLFARPAGEGDFELVLIAGEYELRLTAPQPVGMLRAPPQG